MDLREMSGNSHIRHPWETVRTHAMANILNDVLSPLTRVLDVGCGDGYVGAMLSERFRPREYIGLDNNLSSAQIMDLSRTIPRISFINKMSNIKGRVFELVLLLDVLEHVENDFEFLSEIAESFVSAGGHIMITVPAHESLMGPHDNYLKHLRRYSYARVIQCVTGAGCKVISSGYLFFLPLVLRFLSVHLGRFGLIRNSSPRGVGDWSHGRIFSKAVEVLLRADCYLMLVLCRIGIRIPGLSVWALCKKQ